MSTLGRFHCWDDTAQHPTRPVGAAPSQGSEEVHLHVHIGDDALPRKGRDANAGGRGEANPAGRRNGRLRDQGEDPSEQPIVARSLPELDRAAIPGNGRVSWPMTAVRMARAHR
jgi:hypothetical protein